MSNYLLNQSQEKVPFKYLKAAMVAGMLGNEAFTVEMLEPSMICCYWQPGMASVAWNEPYQLWYEAQQRELQRVMR